MNNLFSKKCTPCEGDTLPLDERVIKKLLIKLSDWKVLNNKKLYRDFKFKNFKEAINFVNKVAELSEFEGHHPDILIYNWNKVKIDLWTHTVAGLSKNDFILAAKINTLI
jgi:4a-hydroxytetrahydrobiopterin dehydratase